MSPWVIETNKGGVNVVALSTNGNAPVTNRYVVLGGTNNQTDSIEQTTIIPASSTSVTLSYALRVQAAGNDRTPHDYLTVSLQANGTTVSLAQYSNADAAEWKTITVPRLEAYAGDLVTLRFSSSNDGTRPTKFYLDNVSLTATPDPHASAPATLSFVSPNYSCSYPAPLGPAVTGSGPLTLVADAPRGVKTLSAAIKGKTIVRTDKNYLDVPIPWSSLPPGESILTGTLVDTCGATMVTSCTINNTNLLQGGDFEASGSWAWNQGDSNSASLIKDLGADEAHSGARAAVLGASGRSAGTLDQVVEIPPKVQDSLVLSFFYETPGAEVRGPAPSLSAHFVDPETGQDTVAATVYPSSSGWTPVRVPISLAQLGLTPGKSYILRFQAGSGRGNNASLSAGTATTFAVDDASLMLLPIDPGGGNPPDDEIPDPDEATVNPNLPNPVPTHLSAHYGRKQGGDQVIIYGSGFDPASIKVKFRRGLSGGNWATYPCPSGIGCNSDQVAGISNVWLDGSRIYMGPTPTCATCGTPKSKGNTYGKARVIVKNVISKNKHGLAFKDSAGNVVGFKYGWPPPTVSSISPSTGSIAGGDTVTIQGTGFVNSGNKQSVVTVGQIALVLDASSFQNQAQDGTYNTIVGTTGTDGWWTKKCPGQVRAGVTGTPVNVLVTNPDGHDGQLENAFTYHGEPPTITGFFPPSGPSIGGTVVTINGTNLGRISGVQFGSASADCSNISRINDNCISVVTPPGCDNGPIKIQTVDNTSVTSKNTYSFTVVEPNYTYSENTEISCHEGGSFTVKIHFTKGASPCDDLHLQSCSLREPAATHYLTISDKAMVNGVSTATLSVTLKEDQCPPLYGSVNEYLDTEVYSRWGTLVGTIKITLGSAPH